MRFYDPSELSAPQFRPASMRDAAPPIRAIVACDLASLGDYTAIAALDYSATPVVVRGLERHRGVPYVAPRPGGFGIVERVREVVETVARRVHRLEPDAPLTSEQLKAVPLVIDKTGVGNPVYDLFVRSGLKPVGITITGGNKANPAPGGFTVPKKDLVFSLVSLFQTGEIKIAGASAEVEALTKELANFRMKIKANGGASYEAWREADHDDLVLATSLAAWYHARITKRGERRPRMIRRPTVND